MEYQMFFFGSNAGLVSINVREWFMGKMLDPMVMLGFKYQEIMGQYLTWKRLSVRILVGVVRKVDAW